MRRYDPGDSADLRHEVRDLDGELTSAAIVAFEIVKPSGEIAPLSPTSASAGVYDVTVPTAVLDELGRYRYRWLISGAVDDVREGLLYVADGDDDDLPPLVDFDKFARKLGYHPEGSELDRADELLAAASEAVRDVAGKTWADEATGLVTGVPRRVRQIVVEAAYRAFTNPEGLSQRSIGDSSKSWDRAGREGGEIVYLTDAEERAVRKAAGTSSLTVVQLASPYGVRGYRDPWDEVTAE